MKNFMKTAFHKSTKMSSKVDAGLLLLLVV